MGFNAVSPGIGTWLNMILRCCDKENCRYKDYGGRGIKVCDRWRDPFDGFKNFFADMGLCPGKGYSLDRIDNNGNYEPGNCRWATWKQQSRNKRSNVVITAFGETGILTDLCMKHGAKIETVRYRLSQGWTPENALTVGASEESKWFKQITAFGKTQHLAAWAREVGLDTELIGDRLRRGWKSEQALAEPAAKNGNKRLVEAFGKTWTLTHLCQHYKATRSAVAYHLDRGLSAEEAVNRVREKRRKKRGLVTAFGKTKSFPQIAKDYGIKPTTLHNRLESGMSIEEALTAPVRPYKKRG